MRKKLLMKLVCVFGMLFITLPAWSTVPSNLLPDDAGGNQAPAIADVEKPLHEADMILARGGGGGNGGGGGGGNGGGNGGQGGNGGGNGNGHGGGGQGGHGNGHGGGGSGGHGTGDGDGDCDGDCGNPGPHGPKDNTDAPGHSYGPGPREDGLQ